MNTEALSILLVLVSIGLALMTIRHELQNISKTLSNQCPWCGAKLPDEAHQ